MKIKNLIVGCGLSGIVLAERIANVLKEEVLIIDKKGHIAGTCYDYKKNNITIQKYGPHAFHTNSKYIWDYLSNFTEWNNFFLKPLVLIDGEKYNLPFNINSIEKIFPKIFAERIISSLMDEFGYSKKVTVFDLKKSKNLDIKFLGDFVFEKVFKNYSEKQWLKNIDNISQNTLKKIKISIDKDNRYFDDKYQAIPKFGFTGMCKNMLDNKKIKILLKTSFEKIKNKISFDRLFWTGSIDEFFEYKFGELPYISLDFRIIKINKEYYQEAPVINYPNNYDFTRITEHKYFLDEESKYTYISLEFPKKFKRDFNERIYPVENEENILLYKKYLSFRENNIFFLGRLGDYKYYNMEQTINRAMEVFQKFLQ